MTEGKVDHDVVVIGAGFAGLYQLIRLRDLGYAVRVLEAGDDVGGTWYWNRYPGARCDIESIEYSYSFDRRLEQEWNWTERYAAQPEILDYIRHVADRYELRPDIEFRTRVASMEWDEAAQRWTVTSDDGRSRTARYVVAATGCLSVPSRPQFDGMDEFAGELYWTSNWPHDGVDLDGKHVAVIGTGSSGLQTITAIAPVVGSLTVYQRTPSYAVPAHNGPVAPRLNEVKPGYPAFREESRLARLGFHCDEANTGYYVEADGADVDRELQRRWSDGGL